jgi:hypothetical protein
VKFKKVMGGLFEAQFIVPAGGKKLTIAKACSTGQSGYIGWRAGTTTLFDFIPQ